MANGKTRQFFQELSETPEYQRIRTLSSVLTISRDMGILSERVKAFILETCGNIFENIRHKDILTCIGIYNAACERGHIKPSKPTNNPVSALIRTIYYYPAVRGQLNEFTQAVARQAEIYVPNWYHVEGAEDLNQIFQD